VARIDNLTFGSITVDGVKHERDLFIFPDGIIREREGGLGVFGSHNVTRAEIEAVASAKPDVLIVGAGAFSAVTLTLEALDFIRQRAIKLEVLNSFEAVKRFNKLTAEGKSPAAMIHITC